jgi:UDP-N-acetylglucosamine 2-epimerase (non-hydrolysing)
MNKILIIFGTRPELIKLAPLIHEFTARNLRDRIYVVNTNQHEELIKRDLLYFQISIDHSFHLRRNGDDLTKLTGDLLLEFHKLKLKLKEEHIKIDALIGQGDTCTTFCSALFSFHEKTPFVHLEAGLRTFDFTEPFPEEFYRKTISSIASTHFAATSVSKQNLIAEGINPKNIHLTGNTVIDNLRVRFEEPLSHGSFSDIQSNVLITIHRRENRAKGMSAITTQISGLAKRNPGKHFLWIIHPGLEVHSQLTSGLENLNLIPAVSFSEMLLLYQKACLILTDSGGIQEEAAYLGIPTLVLRSKTERIEGIKLGISKYFENELEDLDSIIRELKTNMGVPFNTVYGDGFAAKRIVDLIEQTLFVL